jgi:hypothetical protein
MVFVYAQCLLYYVYLKYAELSLLFIMECIWFSVSGAAWKSFVIFLKEEYY